MKKQHSLVSFRSAALGALAAFTIGQPALRAADHRDGPATAHDAATDLADVYFFPETDAMRPNHLVCIVTLHGFIVPGEAANEAIFDPAVNYRFDFYNDHVNTPVPQDPGPMATSAQKAAYKKDKAKFLASIKPARSINVSFTPRVADPGPMGKAILRVPQAQTANVQFLGFKGIQGFSGNPTKDKVSGLAVVNPSLSDTAPSQTVSSITLPSGATDVNFFAGEVDDPFFFDIPGFSRTVAGIRDGTLPGDFLTNTSFLGRGRDTFAGYNALAIAFSIPKAALGNLDPMKTRIGLNVTAQRHNVEMPKNGEVKGVGALKPVDRMGNPAINVAFLPFERKNEYNASTPKDDANGKFAGDIVSTIQALNGNVSGMTINTLGSIAIFSGDLLTLDTGSAVGWPNGRKLTDDVIDTALTVLFETTVKDNVNANDRTFGTTFPYLAPSQQPLAFNAIDGTAN